MTGDITFEPYKLSLELIVDSVRVAKSHSSYLYKDNVHVLEKPTRQDYEMCNINAACQNRPLKDLKRLWEKKN